MSISRRAAIAVKRDARIIIIDISNSKVTGGILNSQCDVAVNLRSNGKTGYSVLRSNSSRKTIVVNLRIGIA